VTEIEHEHDLTSIDSLITAARAYNPGNRRRNLRYAYVLVNALLDALVQARSEIPLPGSVVDNIAEVAEVLDIEGIPHPYSAAGIVLAKYKLIPIGSTK
jgi:hypothetical protein